MQQKKNRLRSLLTLTAKLALLSMASQSSSGQGEALCGSLTNAYGPFDYRRERTGALQIVERAHFTPEVEILQRGKSAALGSDLDYTLRASPNHHRALIAMSNYAIREKTDRPPAANYTVDCYFERAVRFQPDDIVVKLIYVQHLIKTNRRDEALRWLANAADLAKDNPFSHYNIGLLYLEAKDLDKALLHALQSRELGNPRTDLLERIQAAGKPAAATSAPPARP